MPENAKARVEELRKAIKRARKISAAELTEVHALAVQHGGALISVGEGDPDGDWCGTGRIRLPFPPKGGLGSLIEGLVEKGLAVNVGLINGIPPEPLELLIDISRGVAAP